MNDEPDYQDRNARALFVLENEWGKGLIDIGRMKAILTGKDRG